MVPRLVSVLLACAFVVGCSSASDDVENKSLPEEFLGSVKKVVANRREGPVAPVTPSREVIAGLTEPVLQVDPEQSGGSDFLRRLTQRSDSDVGTVEVWRSSSAANIHLRNGVLIGTRGVGGDIIAANANDTISAISSGAAGTGSRTFTISDGDVTASEYMFSCTYQNLGTKGIIVAYQMFNTIHMRETCVQDTQPANGFTNDYWVEPNSGLVRQSRQWVAPQVGYFQLKLLKS